MVNIYDTFFKFHLEGVEFRFFSAVFPTRSCQKLTLIDLHSFIEICSRELFETVGLNRKLYDTRVKLGIKNKVL